MISWDSNDVCASVSISTFVFVFTLSIDYLSIYIYTHNIILFESNIYFRIKRPNQRQTTTTTVLVVFLIEKKTIDRIIKFFLFRFLLFFILYYLVSSSTFNSIQSLVLLLTVFFFIILKHNEFSNRINFRICVTQTISRVVFLLINEMKWYRLIILNELLFKKFHFIFTAKFRIIK